LFKKYIIVIIVVRIVDAKTELVIIFLKKFFCIFLKYSNF